MSDRWKLEVTVNDFAEPMTRVVVILPDDLVEQANALAESNREYWSFGKPSRAAVVRAAMRYFFANSGNDDVQSEPTDSARVA